MSYDPSQGNSEKSLKYLWPVEARGVQKCFGLMLNPNSNGTVASTPREKAEALNNFLVAFINKNHLIYQTL